MLLRSLCVVAAILLAAPAHATSDDEEAVRALIREWYAELRKGNDSRPWRLTAPGAMLLPQSCRCGPQPRALPASKLRYPRFLAERATKFTHEVERLKVERTLARADVWERGFDYAWALKETTQSAAAATFILEKRKGEGWKILVYRSQVRALRPKDKTAPLPDLGPSE
jgi:hypothetical protein